MKERKESLAPVDMNKENGKQFEELLIGKENIGHIVQYFRHMKEMKISSAPVDINKENGKDFAMLIIDEQNVGNIV